MFFDRNDSDRVFTTELRRFFDKHAPLMDHAALSDAVGRDGDRAERDKVWRLLADELGVQGLMVPERFGGAGFGPTELGMVIEESGRVLLPSPLLTTTAAGVTALVLCGDDEVAEQYLPRIAGGELSVTLAIAEAGDAAGSYAIRTKATGSGSRYVLDGAKTGVYYGDEADVVLVVARAAGGPSLFLVDGDAPGIERTPSATLDPTRGQAAVTFRDTPARMLGGSALVDTLLMHCETAISAEQLGGAQACLDLAVAYAKERHTFGRPIASFQAVSHRCAEMLVQIEYARTATWFAALACASDNPDKLSAAVPTARYAAAEAYGFAARFCVQILGGLGFTWEHPAHLHYKRALSSRQYLGGPAAQLERVAGATLGSGPTSAHRSLLPWPAATEG